MELGYAGRGVNSYPEYQEVSIYTGRQKSLLISGDEVEPEVVAIRSCFHCPYSDSFVTSGLFDGC